MKRAFQFAAVAIAPITFSDSAVAQGCSQCLTYASAAGKKAQASLDFGIGVLLFPTLFLFAGILLLFVWRARAAASDGETAEQSSPQIAGRAATSYSAALNSSATRAI